MREIQSAMRLINRFPNCRNLYQPVARPRLFDRQLLPSLLSGMEMKRHRRSPMSPSTSTSSPSQTLLVQLQPNTPPPPSLSSSVSSPTRSNIRKRRLLYYNCCSTTTAFSSQTQTQTLNWVPLNLGKSELCLSLTFPTGQTFRWKQTGLVQFTGVVNSHLVSLKQLPGGDVAYCFHHHHHHHRHGTPNITTNHDHQTAAARLALLDFLNVGISLSDMWNSFSASDPRFKELARILGGARVLRQDPLECLIQFLCSSNNNIKRITAMVDYVSSLGNFLGTVQGYEFHQFPDLERLSRVSESELREAGFGYRAKYITGTVNALQSKPCGGVEWLASLRQLDLQEAIDALSTLPGVGPKVAACIALFSLDHHHAIPVDTHVWKIATRYLIPELAGARLTPKLCDRVADAFVCKYGKYAGWAQTLLFIAELPSQKVLLSSNSCANKGGTSAQNTDGKIGCNLRSP